MFWAGVVSTQLERIEALQDEFARILERARDHGEPIPSGVHGRPYDARIVYPGEMGREALYLVFGVRAIKLFAEKYNGLTHDPRVGQALARFDAQVPMAVEFRDFVAHVDEYAIGKGKHAPLPNPDALGGFSVDFANLDDSLASEDLRGELSLRFGGYDYPLKVSATAGIELAVALDAVWWDRIKT
jgi:hypothetical protein